MINICELQPNKISTNLKSKVFWFHGEPGTWKTTVASKFPKAFIAGFEIGYQFINGVYAAPVATWSDMKDLYRQLKTPAAKEKYDTVVFDTISNASTMCYKYALGQLGIEDPSEAGYGKGWRLIKDSWRIIRDICKLGYCIVFVSHSKEQEVEDKKTKTTYTKVKTDLESWAADDIWGLSDFVFYVRKEINDAGEEQVYAYSNLPNVETKRRHPAFPEKFLFTFDNIMNGLDVVIKSEEEKGHSIDNSNSNLREVVEVKWETVRDQLIELIKKLSNTSASAEVTRYISEMFDVRISETTALYKDKLIAARDYLIELEDKLGK